MTDPFADGSSTREILRLMEKNNDERHESIQTALVGVRKSVSDLDKKVDSAIQRIDKLESSDDKRLAVRDFSARSVTVAITLALVILSIPAALAALGKI